MCSHTFLGLDHIHVLHHEIVLVLEAGIRNLALPHQMVEDLILTTERCLAHILRLQKK